MAAGSRAQPVGQLANVSAALIVPIGNHERILVQRMTESALLLQRLFEDVVLIGDMGVESGENETVGIVGRVLKRDHISQSKLADLALALEAAREERMLVLAADSDFGTAELLLGLTAWPEHECVAPRIGGALRPLCALYQRDVTLGALRESLEREESDLSAFLNQLDCGVIEGDDLATLLVPPASVSAPVS